MNRERISTKSAVRFIHMRDVFKLNVLVNVSMDNVIISCFVNFAIKYVHELTLLYFLKKLRIYCRVSCWYILYAHLNDILIPKQKYCTWLYLNFIFFYYSLVPLQLLYFYNQIVSHKLSCFIKWNELTLTF